MISVACVQYTFKLYTDPWYYGLVRTEVYKAADVPEDGNIVFCDLEQDTTYYYKIELLKHCTDETGIIDMWTTATSYGSFTTNTYGTGGVAEWQYQCLGKPYDVVVSWDFDTSQIFPVDDGLNITWECIKRATTETPIPEDAIVQTLGNNNILHCEVELLGVYGKFDFVLRGYVESSDYLAIELVLPIENVETETEEGTEPEQSDETENEDIVEP